jgi:hypothetical protein
MEEGPSRISTTVTSAEQLAQVLATGIPFIETPYLKWLEARRWTPEPGDEQRILLEHTGSWTAAQDLAIEHLQHTGIIHGLSRSGPRPFPLTAKLALIRAETAARQAEQPPAPARLAIEHPRFVVEERLPAGYAVVDTTMKLPPEMFGLAELEDERSVTRRLRGQCLHFTGIQETHCRVGVEYASVEQAHLTFPCHKDSGLAQMCAHCQFPTKDVLSALVVAYQETALKLRQEHAQKVAEEWAYTWNLVELGYCGNCHRRIANIPGYRPGPGGEPPIHTHTFGHQMYRKLCFDCSCSLED